MRTHLEDDVLLDVMEGAASVEATRHAGECPECGARVAEARAGLAMATSADAPDPSPLYWDVMRRRVASGIAAETPRRRLGHFLAPALLATAATVAVMSFVPRDPGAVVPTSAPIVASSAIPQQGEDTHADAVAAGSIDEFGCLDVDACVASLSDEETRALADALRSDLAGNGDL